MSNAIMMKALPIVAAALGKKHGVNVVIREGASTASTDGKTIYLPVLPDTPLSLVLARGFIDHECAHVRYTDFTVNLGRGLKHTLINVLEDVRIEQQLGRELPGCKINLAALEKAFIETDMYDVVSSKSHPAEILVARIHHCLRVEILNNECTTDLANNAKAMFYKTFPAAMTREIDDLLLEAKALRDTQHVADLADRILAVIQKDQPQQPSPPSQKQDGDEGSSESDKQESQGSSSKEKQDESGKQDEGESSDDTGGNSGKSEEKGEASSDGSQSDEDASDDESDGSANFSQSNKGSAQSDDSANAEKSSESSEADQGKKDQSESNGNSTPIQKGEEVSSNSSTDKKLENQKELKESMDQEIVKSSDLGDKIAQALSGLSLMAHHSGDTAGTMPSVGKPLNGRPIITSEAARETTALRTRLFGLIQASKLKRTPPRRHGTRIDTGSLHKLRTGDTRVFRSSEMRQGINTGVVILLDQSSSMAHMMKDATKAAMAVAIALDTIPGVKLAVAGFGSERNVHTCCWDPVVRPMKLFSQRLDRNGFTPAAEGGTPIAESLWWASSELLGLQSVQRRIVITITDGQPQNPNAVKELVERMKHASIENTAIGIGIGISPDLFPNNCSISDISELPDQVFRMLQDMLVER